MHIERFALTAAGRSAYAVALGSTVGLVVVAALLAPLIANAFGGFGGWRFAAAIPIYCGAVIALASAVYGAVAARSSRGVATNRYQAHR